MLRILAASLLAVAAGAAQAQTLYKCLQAGRTVYQQEPCPETARQSTVRPPDAPAPTPLDPAKAAEREAQLSQSQVDGVVDLVAGYTLCSEAIQGFGGRYAPAFEDWKQRNLDALKRFNLDDAAKRWLDQRLRSERARPAGDDAGAARTEMCTKVLATLQPGRGARK